MKGLDMQTKATQNNSAWKWLSLIAFCLCFSVSADARELFRYKNENGSLVLSHTIPNERVKAGYDIVDEYGNLVRRVAPQLSETAYKEKLRREKMVADCSKFLDRVRKLYQIEADIVYAEQSGLESIDQSILNTRAKLGVMATQREEFELQAAQLDISGQAIPKALLENIDSAKAQEQNLADEVDKRLGDKVDLSKTIEFDRLVFGLDTCDNGLPPRP
jgi:hypothetical protein